jgi:predicted kinase
MHQFPQNCIFSNLLEARKLTELHIKQLAQTVANFHAKSQTNQYINQFGNIENIQYSFIENYQQTKKYINITQTQKQYAETIAFTDEFFNSKKEILKTRQDSQKIRYIHGDLHLNNICFWHDKIQLFDRIEFNDSFCCVDTMYDVAFTMMDLEAKGRQELSNIFLNIYLELTGDWQGVEVLPLYLSRQAYVRAKVNSMALGDSNIDTVQKQKLSESAAAYFQLAWVYSQPKKIFIIIMSGLSGSGKSTVAKYLALGLNAIYIRSDAVRKHLAGISLSQKGDAEIYTTPMNIKTYQQLFTLCKQITASGYSVILDATYNKEHGRQEIIDFAMNNQITYTIIYCDAPMDVIRERLNQRRNDVSDATAELLEHQQLSIDPFTTAEREHLVILDTAGDWQSQLIEKNVFGLS